MPFVPGGKKKHVAEVLVAPLSLADEENPKYIQYHVVLLFVCLPLFSFEMKMIHFCILNQNLFLIISHSKPSIPGLDDHLAL